MSRMVLARLDHIVKVLDVEPGSIYQHGPLELAELFRDHVGALDSETLLLWWVPSGVGPVDGPDPVRIDVDVDRLPLDDGAGEIATARLRCTAFSDHEPVAVIRWLEPS